MPLQPPNYFGNLDPSQPLGTDPRNISDDEHRNAKASANMSFPAVTGAVTATHADLNLTAGIAAGNGKLLTGDTGTTALFVQATAPYGWTITTAFDARMLVVKGTLNGSAISGGDTAGTDDPAINQKVPNHRHAVAANQTATHGGNSQLNQNRHIAVHWNRNPVNAEVMYWLTAGPDFDLEPTYGLTSQPEVESPVTSGAWEPKFAATIACTKS